MKSRRSSMALPLFGLTVLLFSGSAMGADIPGIAITNLVDTQAIVQGVNYQTHWVRLRDAEGNAVTLRFGDGSHDLGELHVGDKVTARYLQAVAVLINDVKEPPALSHGEDTVQLTAPGDEAPAHTTAHVVQVTAAVEGINYQQRWVHLRIPSGELMMVHVPETMERFDKLKVGDRVTARYAEAVAIRVQKQ